jgi:hypothetical protein
MIDMKKILKLLSFINCKEASQIASDAQERPLSLGEKINVYLHLLICKPCVNFNKQLKFMRKATASANDQVSIKPDTGMSDNTRERIRQQLNQKKTS